MTQKPRKIIHIDMDYFYAQVEERENPSLKDKPIAVGGDANRRGVLCTSNYIARQFGVRSAMSTYQALQKCPQLIVLPVNFPLYRAVSDNIRDIFAHYTDLIEPLSLDEAYLDVTECDQHQNSATWIAQAIRQDIFKQEHLTASAGIAPNKFLAKVASDWRKPNGQFTVTPNRIESFVFDLPVKKIFGVGPKMADRLHQMDIHTCADLQKLSLTECLQHFGKMGAALYDRARGIDHREVEHERIRKSLSVEETYPQDLKTLNQCEEEIKLLYPKFLDRLERIEEQEISKLFVKIKFFDFTQTTVEHTDLAMTLKNYLLLLEEGYQRGNKPVRLLGVGVRFKEKSDGEFEQLRLDV